MMNIVLVRIDDRLIHGQVVTSWVAKHEVEQIIVVDEEVANDNMQKSVLKMTAPPNMKVVIVSPDKFIDILSKTEIKRKTMLIFREPIGLLKVLNHGLTIKELNLGGMRKIGKRTKKITKAVYLSTEEQEALKEIISKGIKINVQMVPQDKAENLTSLA